MTKERVSRLSFAALIALVVANTAAWADPLPDSNAKGSTTSAPASFQPESAAQSGIAPKSSFDESFADLIKKADSPESTTSINANPVGPHYGKPLADSLDEEAIKATTTAMPKTLAPFTRLGGFAPLKGIKLPRPLNIPADSSPSLKQAATLVSNLSVVSPTLIRGAQPTADALDLLKKAGVTTVINLRNEPILVEQEAQAAKKLGLNYVNIPMDVFGPPSKKQFQAFLAIVDKSPGPVFVHCMQGEDRTGTMVAIYRMSKEGWDVNRAYQEMTAMGFKSYLGALSGAVFDYAASIGRPGRRPTVELPF